MNPQLSIIIPTLNSEKFLATCLKSVAEQTYSNYEVIVVDAASKDNTIKIAASFQSIRFQEQIGKGLAAAWNQGIRLSEGAYIAFLDSDDWWETNSLSAHMDALLANHDLAYSIGRVKYVAEDPKHLPYGFKPRLLSGTHSALMPGCFVGKRDLFEINGMFEEDLKVATDIQWFHDLKMRLLPSINLDSHVLNKRVHANNLSYTTSETATYNQELLNVIRRRLKLGNSDD